MTNRSRVIKIILFFAIIATAASKRSFGVISTKEDFSYLDRFCFQSSTGHLEYTLTYPNSYASPSLLLYYDTSDQWSRAYKELSKCEDRREVLTNRSLDQAIIRLDPYDESINLVGAKCRLMKDVFDMEWVRCKGTRTFHYANQKQGIAVNIFNIKCAKFFSESNTILKRTLYRQDMLTERLFDTSKKSLQERSMRSRWWFLALAACPDENFDNRTSGLHVEYELLMTNGVPSEILRYQFSDDEWLILPTDLCFLLFQCGLLTVNYIIGCQLSFRRLYHNAYRISTQSLLLDVCGISMMVIAYGSYALDGVGFPFLKLMAELFRGFAQMFFIFMVLLLARGQNVTKMKLSKMDNISLFCLTSFFITSYIGMLFWEIKGFDPALVYFPSESVPGYMLAGWRIAAWIFFSLNSYLTQRAYTSKRKFYVTFVILLTPWFWAGPIVLCVANYLLDNWVREGVINIVDNCVISYGYVVFLYISWPSNANENFPFHIRTTQIDVNFDPQNAYQAKEEETVTSAIPLGTMRPQITTAHDHMDERF